MSRMDSVNATSFGSGPTAQQMAFGKADPAGFQARKVDLSSIGGLGDAFGDLASSLAKLGGGSQGAKSGGGQQSGSADKAASRGDIAATAKMSTSLPGSNAQQFAATTRSGSEDRAAQQGQGQQIAAAKIEQSPQIVQAEQSQKTEQATDRTMQDLKQAEEQQSLLAQNDSNPNNDPLSLFANLQQEEPPPPPPEEDQFGSDEATA